MTWVSSGKASRKLDAVLGLILRKGGGGREGGREKWRQDRTDIIFKKISKNKQTQATFYLAVDNSTRTNDIYIQPPISASTLFLWVNTPPQTRQAPSPISEIVPGKLHPCHYLHQLSALALRGHGQPQAVVANIRTFLGLSPLVTSMSSQIGRGEQGDIDFQAGNYFLGLNLLDFYFNFQRNRRQNEPGAGVPT